MVKRLTPFVSDVKNDNEILPVLSKLVLEKKTAYTGGNNKRVYDSDTIKKLSNIISSSKDKSKLNEDILKLFPDTDKCVQILVSSIVCPNDLITTSINYNLDSLNLPVEISSTIINYVKKYIERYYDLETKLYSIIKETLFLKGSYAEVIIPENLLDEYINSNELSLNSIDDSNNLFNQNNTTYKIAKEDFVPKIQNQLIKNKAPTSFTVNTKDLYIDIENTPVNILRTDRSIKEAKNLAKEKFYKIATEHMLDIEDIFRKPDEQIKKETYMFNSTTAKRDSVSRPLVMKVDPDFLIPIYIKGDPSNHIGYFLITDENYSPINLSSYNNVFSNTYSTNMTASTNSFLVNKAKESLQGMTKDPVSYDDMELMYSNILEKVIKDKLNNSKLGKNVQIGDMNDIYKIMFSRSIRNNETKLIYLPEEMVAYYAHEFRTNGTGKSIIEDLAILNSIRAIAFFARIMAIVRNSINTTVFKVTLDDRDPDPQSTIDDIISSALNNYQLALPIGLTGINNLAEWTHSLGKEFVFSHPKLPNIEIDKQNVSGEKIVPDSDLDEKIFEQICLRCGISMDIVKSGFENDFATTVITKNLLFAKTISLHHIWVNKRITEHVRKLLMNDPVVIENISSIFKDNIKDVKKYNKKQKGSNIDPDNNTTLLDKLGEEEIAKLLTFKVVNSIDCSLPAPEITDSTSLGKTFAEEMDNVAAFMDKVLAPEILPEALAGEASQHIDMIKSMITGLYSIDWASKNGLYKSILDLILDSPVEDGNKNKLAQSYSDISNKLISNILALLKDGVKFKTKYGKKFEELESELAPEEDEMDIGGETGMEEGEEPMEGEGEEMVEDEMATDDEMMAEDDTAQAEEIEEEAVADEEQAIDDEESMELEDVEEEENDTKKTKKQDEEFPEDDEEEEDDF